MNMGNNENHLEATEVLTKGQNSARLKTVSMEPLLAFYMFASFIKYPVFQALLYEKSCISRYKVQVNKFLHKHLVDYL